MLIKDLIKKLEDLYTSYGDDYKSVMGEPDIMIDVFSGVNGVYQYRGISPVITIEKSGDGVFDILSAIV